MDENAIVLAAKSLELDNHDTVIWISPQDACMPPKGFVANVIKVNDDDLSADLHDCIKQVENKDFTLAIMWPPAEATWDLQLLMFWKPVNAIVLVEYPDKYYELADSGSMELAKFLSEDVRRMYDVVYYWECKRFNSARHEYFMKRSAPLLAQVLSGQRSLQWLLKKKAAMETQHVRLYALKRRFVRPK